MKEIISILVLTFSFGDIVGQNTLAKMEATQKSFPTNLNTENFGKLNMFDGKIVAFDGKIEQKEISRNKTPFYKLKVVDSNYLWTVLMFNNEVNKIGDTIRVVGYLRPTPKTTELNEIEKLYLNGRFIVIAFGLIDFKANNFLFLESAKEQKQEWLDGKIPSSK